MLRHRASVDPDKTAFIYLAGDDLDESRLTYGELDREARSIAANLSEHDVVGRPVILLEAPGLQFMAALFGCLYAGAIVVPNYPPAGKETSKASSRFLRIAHDARPSALVGSGKTLAIAKNWAAKEIPCIDLDSIERDRDGDWIEPELTRSALALIQYTSGSTGSPKGVTLTHGNFLANLRIIARATGVSRDSVGVSWLPPYHDMGLTSILLPVYSRFLDAHMAPSQFMFRPSCWLEAITRYKGTICAAPNFAYELCVSRISREQRANLNLSSWEVALNGAEPIRCETLNRFSETFADCGFESNAMRPCYGLAEATLWVSGEAGQTSPLIETFSKKDLEQGLVMPLGDSPDKLMRESMQKRLLVSTGKIADGFEVRIVDSKTGATTPPNEVGEIWISGSSVSSGYWNNEEATAKSFADRNEEGTEKRFLRTGDLGFIHKGELYLTGRLKDLIIVRGLNYYPQDVEQVCTAAHPAIKADGACAFLMGKDEVDQVAVVCEIARAQIRQADLGDVARRIRAAVGEELGLQITSVVLLKQGAIPRTTSGKIRRFACAQGYRDKVLTILHRSDLAEDRAVAPGLHEEHARSSEGAYRLLPATKQGETLRRWSLLADPKISPNTPQISLLEKYLVSQLSVLLRLPGPAVETQIPIKQLGLDSLTLVELHLAMEAEFQISVDPGLFTFSNTVQEIATLVQKCLLEPLLPTQEPTGDNQPKGIDKTDAGEIPLLPIQQELLQQNAVAPSRNFVMLFLRTPVAPDPVQIRRVLEWLVARHDAFQLRFRFFEGRWHQEYGTSENSLQFEILNMRGLRGERVKAQAAAVEEELLKGFNLEGGPLFRSFLYDRGSQQRGLLCLAFHHLAIDALSIMTLVAEFNQCWSSLGRGQGYPSLKLPDPSFGLWARRLSSMAQSREVEAELDYWVSVGSSAKASWPWDSIAPGVIEGKDTAHDSIIEGELTGDQADHVLKRWNSAEDQHDLFLAALAFSWSEATGKDCCYVELEHHGRIHFAGESKPQRTVGWLVHHFPLLVKVPRSESRLNFFESVRQSRAGIPNEGIGFGLLRYMSKSEAVREQMGEISIPKLRFVYRARIDDTFRSNVPFAIMKHSAYGQDSLPDPHNPALVLYAHRSREGVGWSFRYSPERFPVDKVNFLSQRIKKYIQDSHNSMS
ncbi:MAG: AMP-binding protein [Roseibacillus sp.]|nr:AMP-binding protein [Roseibacillus sp.]